MTYNTEIRKGVTLRLIGENHKFTVIEDDGTNMVTIKTLDNLADALRFYEDYYKTECDMEV